MQVRENNPKVWEDEFLHKAVSRSTPAQVDLSSHPTFEFIVKLALLKEGGLPKE